MSHHEATQRMRVEHSKKSAEGVGRSVLRNEDRRFLDGGGEYVADIQLPGMLECAFLRSPVAHAVIKEVTLPDAWRPRIFVSGDIAFAKPIIADGAGPSFRHSAYPALANGKVRFVGEMIAACIAPTRAQAEDMTQACSVDFDELPVVWDMDVALAGSAPLIHEGWPANDFLTVEIKAGDLERAKSQSQFTVRRSLRMGRHVGVPLETRGVIAHFDRRLGELVVHSSTQFPHVIRTILATTIGLPESKLRVIAPDVGGGFGPKNNLQPEEVAIAAIAMKTGRPVRWIEDRREHLIASPHAREHRYDLIGHTDERGKVLGLEATVRVDAGAYSVWPWTAGMEAGMAAGIMTGPYDIQAYHARAITVCTNKAPLGPYRGVGRTGACFAIETLLDEVARTVGRNPEDVRVENMVRPEQMPYRSITGKLYDSGDYIECAKRTVAEIDADGVRARQLRGESDGRMIGLGFASYTEQSAHGTAEWVARGLPVVFGYEPAIARFTPDGKLILLVGVQNHGQGLETTLAQIAHQELGISVADVVVRHGDSSLSPYGMGTFASRSMTMSGGAVSTACRLLAAKVKQIGAHLLQAPVDAVVLDGGCVRLNDQQVDIATICEAAYLHPERLPTGVPPALEESAVYEPERSTGAFSYASHACTVAVDPGTGKVELLDYVVCHDCGTIVNPMIVEAQVVGGVAQGIGTALYEEMPYDENGQPLASTFLDYMIPGFPEVPDVRVLHMETPSPHTRFGIKGMGEGGAIAPPAVIINAVNDALRRIGVRLDETPITPERVRAAIAARVG